MEAESSTCYSLGGAYRITDPSPCCRAAFRGRQPEDQGQRHGTLKSTLGHRAHDEAINYSWASTIANKDLNIALTYMSNTRLDFEARPTTFSGKAISAGVGWKDGTREREDLPGYLALGVTYFIVPGKVRIEPNFTYYLEDQAKLEGQRFKDSNPGNSYDAGVAVEYIVNPQWRFSVGYLPRDQG
jgi:hypothetical protein